MPGIVPENLWVQTTLNSAGAGPALLRAAPLYSAGWAPRWPAIVLIHYTHEDSGQTPHIKKGTRVAADPKSTQRRTISCAEGSCLQARQNAECPDGHVFTGGCSDEKEDEEEGGGHENTGRKRRAPPAYDELSSHFGVLKAAAVESGNGDAAFYLTKEKMAMIAAHSAKRVRQANMRQSVAT